MDLSAFHPWLVFVHVLGVLIFVMAHGVSVFVMWRLRTERDPQAVRTLAGLSRRSLGLMNVGLLILLLGGVLAGFSGNWWTSGRYWIWAAVLILILIFATMTPLGRLYLTRVRTAVGIDNKTGAYDPNMPVDAAQLEMVLSSGKPELLLAIGLGGLAILLWLMMFKPF
jgi:hypothetical protein